MDKRVKFDFEIDFTNSRAMTLWQVAHELMQVAMQMIKNVKA